MADTFSEVEELNITLLFADTDTRIIKLRNPKEEITQSEILNIQTQILNGGGSSTLLISDKTGADFLRIEQAIKRTTTTLNLDLG